MKTINKLFFLNFLVFSALVTGCSSGSHTASLEIDSGGGGYPGAESDIVGGEIGGSIGGDGEGEEPKEPFVIPSGQLTCSALDDNKYYDYWKSLSSSTQEGEGIFQSYKNDFAFNTFNRLHLNIVNGNNIKVRLNEENATYFHVDNLNEVNLFLNEVKEEYEVEISYLDQNNEEQKAIKTVKDNDVIDLENNKDITNNIEIMFVIDATGSMGDEINYIKAEIDDVISKVKENNEEINLTLAIMMYRDLEDDYVTKYSDFSKDIAKQQEFLKEQFANGGGDFEEAVDVALEEAMSKQWSKNSTKLLFHVADAPSHDQDVAKWNKSALKAAEMGIKIITVASSGINKKTEYFFRSQSLLTSGQYVFLTNDSGIGGSHLEATVQEKLVVEYLNDCLIRLINGYYSGEFSDPIPYNQNQQ